MENHMQFWAFLQVCMCCWAQNLLSSSLDSSRSAGFRAWGPCVQYWADAGMRLRWWDAWSICMLIPRLISSAWRYSRRVLRFRRTPWWEKDASRFRLSRRAGWCWGAWLILGCGFLGRPSLRLRHRWSFTWPGFWWPPFSLWECECRAWPCQRCPRRWSFRGRSCLSSSPWSYPKPSKL